MAIPAREIRLPVLKKPNRKLRGILAKTIRASLATFFLLTVNASAAVTISPDHPELLQRGILDAYAAGQRTVVVPAGVYQIPSQTNGIHLDLENLSNFEIDATGATFLFQDVLATGVLFNNCLNVYFHGATLYYGTPPYSQGVIRAVAADGSSLDVQIEKGYPTNLDDPKYFTPQIIGHLFDSTTRLWKRNVAGDIYGNKTQRLASDTFRIFTDSLGGAAAGDLVAFRSGTGDTTVRVNSSSRMTLSNLTVYNASGFVAVSEADGGDMGPNHYSHITVTRGPRPTGATTDPLFTTLGGFDSTEMRNGPDVENCDFEYMPDDGIAISGHYSWVIEAAGNTLIVSNTSVYNGAGFLPGDPLRLVDANDRPAGEAIVTSVVPLPNYQNTRKSQRTTIQDFTIGPYYQITLDRVLNAGFDYLAGNPNANGAGFVLLNNIIRNNREHGMLLFGDNGIVEGNLIDGSTVEGIGIGPSFFWDIANYNRNLVIRNNTIRDVGYWSGGTAAIAIVSDGGPVAAGAFQNILIDGNTFEDFDMPALFISSASGVTVSNNIFRNLQNAPPAGVYNFGEPELPGALVYVTQSSGVEIQGNSSSQLGPLNTAFVDASASANVQGSGYASVVADSDTDFSGTQGAHNWYYGYFSSGNVSAFTQLPTYDAADFRWQHTTFGPPWTVVAAGSGFHPNGSDSGTEEWAVRRWVSSVSGTMKVTGHLAKTDTNPASTGVYGRIYLNHKVIYEHFVAGTDGTGVDYSLTETLNPGDILDFVVAPNGSESNDSTLFSSYVIATVSSVPPGSAPSIAAVVSAATGQAGVAPGSYVSIYGSNFAPAGFLDTWNNSVIGGKLPVKLDGVSVSMAGQAAYVASVTANQINVVAPNVAAGPLQVTVTTAAGTSGPFAATAQTVQPGLFEWPGNQAVATHADYSYAVRNGTFSVATTPAKPGEVIILWATGCGPTTPAAPSGQVVPAGSYTVNGVTVTLGGQPVAVLGTALTSGLAGVYQIAIQLPSILPSGDYEVVATVRGSPSPASVLLTVQQ
jgi:uncharacterized protein (TIGR03437 family)